MLDPTEIARKLRPAMARLMPIYGHRWIFVATMGADPNEHPSKTKARDRAWMKKNVKERRDRLPSNRR